MKIAELYRCVLLSAADDADNYPTIFNTAEIEIAFKEIQKVIEAIRDRSDEWLDDYQIMSADYEEKCLREIFEDVYPMGMSGYIDVMLENYDYYGEF